MLPDGPKADAMINSQLLRENAYRDSFNLDRRKALYQFTHPQFIIEDEVINISNLKDNQSLLDVGCGTGKLLLKVTSLRPDSNLFGIDISAGVFKNVRTEAVKKRLPIHFQVADAQQMPFANASFNRVFAMHMLYHLQDIDQALSQIKRVLKFDGMAIITANSMHNRKKLNILKAQAAKIMGRETFTDPNMRFNLEYGSEMVKKHFPSVRIKLFESMLRLNNPQPYLDYFDSLRLFWQPIPSDYEWSQVLASTKKYVETQIKSKGEFTDQLGFGIIIASKA